MKILIFLVIISICMMGMAAAEDFVKVTDILPKDVGELSAGQINMIFENDVWFVSGGPSIYTPSQNDFLKDDVKDGKGLGGKPLLIGSITNYTPEIIHYFTPFEFGNIER